MFARWSLALALVFAAAPALAQKPDEPKKADPKPADKKEEPKKADPKKATGQLPMNWKALGLTDEQVQKVYKLQAKYNDDIDGLEAKIKELKDKMQKERLEVLTADQKKRLEDILKEKSGTGDKKDK